MSVAITFADAVVEQLNAEFGFAPPAVRAYAAPRSPSELDELAVFVFPMALTGDPQTRDSFAAELRIGIGLRQKADAARADQLLDLVERIAARFWYRDLAGVGTVAEVDATPLYSPEDMRQGVFLSYLVLAVETQWATDGA